MQAFQRAEKDRFFGLSSEDTRSPSHVTRLLHSVAWQMGQDPLALACGTLVWRQAMASNVKPISDGYHTITPYLSIKGAAAALEF
jgi:hypothetical protein